MGRKAGIKDISLDTTKRQAWALELLPHFQQKGIKGFGMDKVAHTLQISKATLYKYFRTREDILEILISYKIHRIALFEERLRDENVSFEKRYFNAVEILSDSIGDISTKFLFDLKKYHPELWEKIEVFKAFAITVLSEFYIDGIRAGKIYEHELSILKLADELFFSALLNPEFLVQNNLSLQNAFTQYFNLKWNGMKKG